MPPEETKVDETQKITAALYEHNLELAVKNKTLSLLEKLYQTSILTLAPGPLGQSIADTIREDLNLEFAGVFLFEKDSDSLVSLAFSHSHRLEDTLKSLNFSLKDVRITDIAERPLWKQTVYSQTGNLTNDLAEVWQELISDEATKKIKEESHIETVLLHPLMKGKEVLGVLLLGLNRNYETLNAFEKESIKSFINVIALSLDKAYLYTDLQDANEKLKSLDKLKTEFLSLASHQLRSPLTAIIGYTSMLLDGSFGAIDDKQKEAVDRVFQSSKHLRNIVEDLLNVAKIEQGGMQYVMAPFDFEKAAKDLSDDLSITAKQKGLTLTFETDGKSPYTVIGDMEKVRQVLLNLIDNSIKYTKQGGMKVKLIKDEKVKKVIWSITDTGMGMTPEIKATLFRKFARGEGGKVNTGGSGLGLYLAKEIIEGHKGHVWVESPGPGLGATFFVELDAAN